LKKPKKVSFERWLATELLDNNFVANYQKYKNNEADFFIGKCLFCDEEEAYFCSLTAESHSCSRCGKFLERKKPEELEWYQK
jgi:hypothetical protein